jgi:ABC-type branched-subunit amino acid transport system substrate-binding protein
MNPTMQAILTKAIGVACAIMMVTSLSVIAVQRAEHRPGTQVAAKGSNSGGDGYTPGDANGPSGNGSDTSGGSANAAAAGGSTSAGGGAAAAGHTGPGATSGGGTAASGAAAQTQTGGQCQDYNPDQGVFCDHFLVGGTTVLSGPLAVYGEGGLKGGQAWLTYYNKVLAPQEHLRQIKLIYYDDSDDPNKCLQFTQRMVEVDKVTYLAGVTSPGAIKDYLEQKGVPLIGDIGLSPLSYQSKMIFPTAIAQVNTFPLRAKFAKEDFGIKNFAVIQDVLPGVDDSPFVAAWKKAASEFGLTMTDYEKIDSAGSSCDQQFLAVLNSKPSPDYIFLPTASTSFLACIRSMRSQQVKPNGGATSVAPNLKGFAGGSNLQIEVDQCGDLCKNQFSAGSPFADPTKLNTPQTQLYLQNMRQYASGVEVSQFIAENYYHIGWVFYNLVKQNHIENNISRASLAKAASHFGPFDTGFGNSITWTDQLPRIPSLCMYRVTDNGSHWQFDTKQECLDPGQATT